MSHDRLTHLRELESESIYILREVAAQFEKPALLFSGGKDSIVMAYLAYKAFYPAAIPFPFVHIDTGHNFEETITYRDELVKLLGAKLIVGSVEDSIAQGKVVEEKGFNASRNKLQTVTLLDTLEQHKFDAALGGARRDEEKARAKERFFSHRDEFGQWDPKNQRPELWNIFNGKKQLGEHFRIFPSAIGQKWMFGNILCRKTYRYHHFTTPTNAKFLSAMALFTLPYPKCLAGNRNPSWLNRCDAEPLAILLVQV